MFMTSFGLTGAPTPTYLGMPANLARRAGREKPIAHDKSLLLCQGWRGKARCGQTGAYLKNSVARVPSMPAGAATMLCAIVALAAFDRPNKYFKYCRVNIHFDGLESKQYPIAIQPNLSIH